MNKKEYMKQYMKQYALNNKEKLKEYKHQYYLKNKKRLNELNKKYIKEHPEMKKEIQRKYYYSHYEQMFKVRAKAKEHTKEYDKQYRIKNKEIIKQKRRKYQKERLEKDKLFRMKRQIRNNIRTCFLKKGEVKNKTTEEIIGISLNEFYNYLLKTYEKNYGTKWNGIEKVHIDHIIPLATAKNAEDIIKLCHYTNLQLLTAKDNLIKQDKMFG